MKRLAHLSYMFLLSALLAACSEVDPGQDGYLNIQMRAAISDITTFTKADPLVSAVPWRGTTPSSEVPLKVKLLFSMESGIYKSVPTSSNFLPCHTWIEYTDNQFHDPAPVTYAPAGGSPLTDSPKYPTSRDSNNVLDKVYCTGLYPDDGWTIPDDGQTANCSIDGMQDIMYAPEISASSDNLFMPQTYRHLLTWIKVCVCATSKDALETWGNIEKVYVTGKSSMGLNLATGVPTFSVEQDYPVHDVPTPLETVVSDVGSVFCAPATSFVVKVKSSNFNDLKTVIIKRDPSDDTARFEPGKLYVLEIYFGTSSAEGICRLVSWDYQDENLNMN